MTLPRPLLVVVVAVLLATALGVLSAPVAAAPAGERTVTLHAYDTSIAGRASDGNALRGGSGFALPGGHEDGAAVSAAAAGDAVRPPRC